jgi:adenylate kinase family enzyme
MECLKEILKKENLAFKGFILDGYPKSLELFEIYFKGN